MAVHTSRLQAGGVRRPWVRFAGRATNEERGKLMYPPPAIRTSHTELLGTTIGLILTAVVAVVGLAVMIGAVFLADAQPDIRRRRGRRRGELSGRGPGTGVSLVPGGTPAEQIEHRHVPEGGHPHGKPASWALVGVVIAAFATGGVAIIAHAWWLVWTCAGIIVLAIPAGKAVGIMNDTVSGDSTPPAAHDPSQNQGADSRDQRAPAQK
jgi:hypothetical protein